MNEFVGKAHLKLLEPVGISSQEIDRLLQVLNHRQIDYGDMYFQYTVHESWSLEDGAVKSGSRNIDQGVGIRAVSGEKTGFSYSDELSMPILTEAATAARAIARNQEDAVAPMMSADRSMSYPALYQPVNPVGSLQDEEKIALLKRVESVARSADSRVSQVMASLAGLQQTVLIIKNDGQMVADVRPLIRLNVSVITEQGGRREQGAAGGGGRYDY